jgi:hypothetical protein
MSLDSTLAALTGSAPAPDLPPSAAETVTHPAEPGPAETRILFQLGVAEGLPVIVQSMPGEEDVTAFDPTSWHAYRRTGPIRACRVPFPFACLTIDGNLAHCEDGWLAVDEANHPYPIAAEVFERSYEPAGAEEFVAEPLTLEECEALLEDGTAVDGENPVLDAARRKLQPLVRQGSVLEEELRQGSHLRAVEAPETSSEPAPEFGPGGGDIPSPEIADPGLPLEEDAFMAAMRDLFAGGEDAKELRCTEAELEAIAAFDGTTVGSHEGRTMVGTPFGTLVIELA